MILAKRPLNFTYRFKKNTKWWFVKEVEFSAELAWVGGSDYRRLMNESFWYIFADYAGKLMRGEMKLKPRIFVNGMLVENNDLITRTCPSKEDLDFFIFVDYVDLSGVCIQRTLVDKDDVAYRTVNWGERHIELVDNNFVYTMYLTCQEYAEDVEIKKVEGENVLSLKNGRSLILQDESDCVALPENPADSKALIEQKSVSKETEEKIEVSESHKNMIV
jgi:hypothetical protein